MNKKLFIPLGLICLMLFTSLIYIFETAPFYSISQKIDDINYKLSNNTPSKDVVFIAVDEKSVNRFGRWPWKRSLVAQGLKKLDSSRVVLLDIAFSEKSDENEDKILSNALSSLGDVVCGFFLRKNASEFLDKYRKKILSLSSLERIISKNLPLPHAAYAEASIEIILESCLLNASFSTFPDKDGIFRKYPLGFIYDNSVYPSLGVQGLRVFLNNDILIRKDLDKVIGEINEFKIDFNFQGVKRLNYYKYEDYKVISFIDLFNEDFDDRLIDNKIVILGITEAGISDIRSTPIGAVPGPILHYTFLSNVLNGHQIIEKRIYTILPVLILSIFPFLISFKIKNVLPRSLINLIIISVFIFISKKFYINSNIWIETFYPLFSIVVSMFYTETLLFMHKERESLFVKQAFSAYVSPVLLKQLAKDPSSLKLGGEEKEITTIFCDIRNFTTISEALDSKELVNMLKELFNPLTNIIQSNSGFLDKYIGDAIMAFYNAPLDVEDHAKKACKSGLEMMRFMATPKLREKVKIDFELNIGIGINTGEAVVGNTGSDSRFNYTALGDSVNLASRLQDLNKQYSTRILISENTKKLIGDDFLTRKIETVMVKGKTKGVLIYELMENTKENRLIKKLFEKAIDSGLKEDLINCYNETGDVVSKVIIERD